MPTLSARGQVCNNERTNVERIHSFIYYVYRNWTNACMKRIWHWKMWGKGGLPRNKKLYPWRRVWCKLHNDVGSCTTPSKSSKATSVSFAECDLFCVRKDTSIHLLSTHHGSLLYIGSDKSQQHTRIRYSSDDITDTLELEDDISSMLGKRTTKKYSFTFDRVRTIIFSKDQGMYQRSLSSQIFKPSTSQSECYEDIAYLVQSALDGYSVCIFAYGQTGSGKVIPYTTLVTYEC